MRTDTDNPSNAYRYLQPPSRMSPSRDGWQAGEIRPVGRLGLAGWRVPVCRESLQFEGDSPIARETSPPILWSEIVACHSAELAEHPAVSSETNSGDANKHDVNTGLEMIMKRQLLALGILLACAFTTLAATPPPEKLLPADTVAVLTVPDFTKASAILETSATNCSGPTRR